jgi:hypothetical protein
MTDQEAYEAGLRTLGLTKCNQPKCEYVHVRPDLRKDPAFAWRVLEALRNFDYGMFLDTWATRLCGELVDEPLSDALYAAVCELGRQKP